MRDGPFRRAVKGLMLGGFYFDLKVTRAIQRVQGQPRYLLEGTCEGCGRCCEEPSIQVNRFVWSMPILRWCFLTWQRLINGFELKREERKGRVFVFVCTHYDPATRLCDSYASRPGMCRDYPRGLLFQPWPEFFPECTHRPVSKCGEGLLEGLRAAGLSEEELAELEKRLKLK